MRTGERLPALGSGVAVASQMSNSKERLAHPTHLPAGHARSPAAAVLSRALSAYAGRSSEDMTNTHCRRDIWRILSQTGGTRKHNILRMPN